MTPSTICLRFVQGHWLANRTMYLDRDPLGVLQAMSAQGVGARRLKYENYVFASIDDAIAFLTAGYQIKHRGTSLKPRHLNQVAALGGRIVAYSEKVPGRTGKVWHQRSIVFPDLLSGIIAEAHCLPAGHEMRSKEQAVLDWEWEVPDCSPTLQNALKQFAAAPTATTLHHVRMLVTMERRH